MKQTKRDQEHFRGCLLGGAIGDALGWPIEFSSSQEVIVQYGKEGIRDLVVNSRGIAEISDDTQLTLFTAEGIISDDPMGVYKAYIHWLHTQGYREYAREKISEIWLVNVPEMHVRRAPGITCVKALQSNRCGSPTEPINNSKGCGCVMRMAPAGLFYSPDDAFEKGVEFAAITHGHPLGYLSAGAFSYLISNIMEGVSLQKSVENTLQKISQYREARESFEKIEQAYRYAKTEMDYQEVIHSLGLGWVSEEALSIGIYCALRFQNNIEMALLSAVNHDGDSDSTGSITGNILGAFFGKKYLPQTWVDKLELKEVILQVADELWMKCQETLEKKSDFYHSADLP